MEALDDDSPFKAGTGRSEWDGYDTKDMRLTIYSECCSAFIDNVDDLRVLRDALTDLIEDIEALNKHERTDDGTLIDLDTIKGEHE